MARQGLTRIRHSHACHRRTSSEGARRRKPEAQCGRKAGRGVLLCGAPACRRPEATLCVSAPARASRTTSACMASSSLRERDALRTTAKNQQIALFVRNAVGGSTGMGKVTRYHYLWGLALLRCGVVAGRWTNAQATSISVHPSCWFDHEEHHTCTAKMPASQAGRQAGRQTASPCETSYAMLHPYEFSSPLRARDSRLFSTAAARRARRRACRPSCSSMTCRRRLRHSSPWVELQRAKQVPTPACRR